MAKKSRSFLASFTVLLVFAAFVFFVGWTGRKVDAGKIGIVVSKTSGVSRKIAENGKISWFWQFLIPKNAELKTFSVLPYGFRKTVSGTLPSADFYNIFSGSKPDFSYSADFSFSLEISPEGILNLVRENKISDQASLDSYLERKAASFSEAAENLIVERFSSDLKTDGNTEKPFFLDASDIIRKSGFFENNPELDIADFSVTNQKLPDYNLYRKAKDIFSREWNSPSYSGSGFYPDAFSGGSESGNLNPEDEKNAKFLYQILKSLNLAGNSSAMKKGGEAEPAETK